MLRHALMSVLALGAMARPALAYERNFTLRGEGYVEMPAGGRRALREVRMTLRDNDEFLATLVTSAGETLARSTWRRASGDDEESIRVTDLSGRRLNADGTLQFSDRNHQVPLRLQFDGSQGGRSVRVVMESERISGSGNGGYGNNDDRGGRGNGGWGRGDRVSHNIDAVTYGDGQVRFPGTRDGRFGMARARIGTGRDVIIDIDQPTRGTIKGILRDISGNALTVRVTDIFGYDGGGDMTVTLLDGDRIDHLRGNGTSARGKWQVDFTGTDRNVTWRPSPTDNGGWTDDRDNRDDRNFSINDNLRGSGSMSQDVGPSLRFDEARVQLDGNHAATIVLGGRRDSMRLYGTWRRDGDGDVTVQLNRVNEIAARGTLTLDVRGRNVSVIDGDGRTDRGTFRLRFESR